MFREIRDKLLDILFPRICINCKHYLGVERKLCLLCKDCSGGVNLFRVTFRTDWGGKLLALGPYEDDVLKATIHCLKYREMSRAMAPIREWLKQCLNDLNVRSWINKEMVIIPIPLHPARLRRRGFNQAQLIAEVLSDELSLSIEMGGLKRIKNTEAQAEIKDKDKRRTNVRGCFMADQEKFSGKSILLVDDVYTSGATIREAAIALRKAGAKEINVFVLAKAG